MSKLLDKIRKNTVLDADILKNSKYFDNKIVYPTDIPLLNLALTGSFDGGITPGVTMLAAPPKHFKTCFMLEGIKAFQNKNEKLGKEHVTVFYDCEGGATPAYFERVGIDITKVDHRPFYSVEELRVDITKLVHDLDKGDEVLICIDSLGAAPSTKEVQDALTENEAQDMTRAKQIKSLFRIITPHLVFKSIPAIVVNHSYQTQEKYSKEVASGGRGAQYAGHTLIFIGKVKDKEGDEQVGNTFPLRIALSRYVREGAEFRVTVTYEEGIYKNSGIFDLALDLGFIEEASKGFYWKDAAKTEKTRRSAIEDAPDFVSKWLANKDFVAKVSEKFKL